MRKKSQRMEPVAQVTARRKEDAAKALGESNQAVAEQEKRLADLRHYRDEYARYCQQKGGEGISSARFQELQLFMANLDAAIKQQQQAVEVAKQEQLRRQKGWQSAHNRNRAMDKVIDRYRDQERQEEDKREQKQLDEHAQRHQPGKGHR